MAEKALTTPSFTWSRRLSHRGRATRLAGLFRRSSLGHDSRHLTRGHDRHLRIHELQNARLHALWQAFEPLQPPVGS
jgi:hypothetical protein